MTQTFVNAIARHLRIPPSEKMRLHYVGTIHGNPTRYTVLCPHGDVPICIYNDSDPFGGRVPTAKELEEWFEGGAKVTYKAPTMRRHPLDLDGLQFARVAVSHEFGRTVEQVETVIVYCGQCPDCGLVLVGMGEP